MILLRCKSNNLYPDGLEVPNMNHNFRLPHLKLKKRVNKKQKIASSNLKLIKAIRKSNNFTETLMKKLVC